MFYTYAHITLDTNKVFYIGKGAGRRLFRKDARNQHWHNVVKKHGYKAVKLAEWATSEEAFEHEKFLISCFKDMEYKLVNQSEGGDGNSALGGFSWLVHTEWFKKFIDEIGMKVMMGPYVKYSHMIGNRGITGRQKAAGRSR